MRKYSVEDVLRVAKRHNNKKRSYLLVNPLQGKHLPVSPTAAIEMMQTLGEKISAKVPNAKLVVGFAETATAIGAIVAEKNPDCFYIHTTRENYSTECNVINFFEEHSHAPEQKLYTKNFCEMLKKTSAVIFVDDELTTGKTLLNIIRQLKTKFPELGEKNLIAASIINRLSKENERRLAEENIFCEYLVKISDEKVFNVDDIKIQSAETLTPTKNFPAKFSYRQLKILSNPRFGVSIGEYFNQCENVGERLEEIFNEENISQKNSVLIVGTEECMLPALIAGRHLEQKNFSVVTHATTRSPIGISNAENYPIREGFTLRSFYDTERTTYIYNLKNYDAVVILSDAENFRDEAVGDLISAIEIHGCKKIIFIGVLK